MPIPRNCPNPAEIETLDLAALRSLWAQIIGPVPALRSADMLRQILAWHIQAVRHGGLDGETRRRLGQRHSAPITRLHHGTRIVKEWQGRRYEILVEADGPLFEGRRYRSLSEIARHITGTRWNGPRFFGLRDQKVAA